MPKGPEAEDLTGQKFGRLTVVERAVGKDKRRVYWLCRCDCGNMKTTLKQQLKNGMCRSCGCLNVEANKSRIVNLTGKKVGRLTVIEQAESRNGKLYWLCKCECGTTKEVVASSLQGNRVISCGCAKIVHGDLTGKRFGRLVVLECPRRVDYRKRRVWKCICDCGNEVDVVTDTLVSGDKSSCGCAQYEQNVENMRRYLERDVVYGTSLHSIANKKVRKGSTTGIRGVGKWGNRYRAHIGFQKKNYHLGIFDTIDEATAARKAAEEELHDSFLEWYYENHPEQQKKEGDT